jgi:hypothetical protein
MAGAIVHGGAMPAGIGDVAHLLKGVEIEDADVSALTGPGYI